MTNNFRTNLLRSLAGAATAVLVVTYIWWSTNQPHVTPSGELHDLYQSPVCLAADGTGRPGSPTVAEGWARTVRTPLAQAQPTYHGDRSIELHIVHDGLTTPISFLRVAGRAWRPAADAQTATWVAEVCGRS